MCKIMHYKPALDNAALNTSEDLAMQGAVHHLEYDKITLKKNLYQVKI